MDFMIDFQALMESVRQNGLFGGGACEKARQVQYGAGAARGLAEQVANTVCPAAIGAGVQDAEVDQISSHAAELAAAVWAEGGSAPAIPAAAANGPGALLDPETKKQLIEFALKVLLAFLAKYTS